jgi:magnesium-transporting ATPase (P-type)
MTQLTRAGLTSAQARAVLNQLGPNRLPAHRRKPWWDRLAAEMAHFFAILLWAASVLAFVAGMPQLGIAVAIVVVLNGGFAFAQEERAQHASEELRRMLPQNCTVFRDDVPQQVSAEELVCGDLMQLSQGDRISADATIVDCAGFAVDTSALTGESVPEHPRVGEGLFAGCFVTEGEARALVVATGARTRLADIANLTEAQPTAPTPLRLELARLSRAIAIVAVAVGAAFFAIALLVGMPASGGFLFAVGVTVAVVPEGLLPTITLSLAIGGQRMAEKHALVRHLEAVETLGSTTFICTDKTGTLTRNEMSVVEAWTPFGTAIVHGEGYQPTADVDYDSTCVVDATRAMARAAVLCSSGRIHQENGEWKPRGDPMEAALDAFAYRVGTVKQAEPFDSTRAKFPFDTVRRRMSVVVDSRVFVKGAPESIFPLCRETGQASDSLQRMTLRGLRVLAIAARDLRPGETPETAAAAEEDLELLGLIALQDPPRPGVHAVLEQCRRAGMRVAMITGDHPETAAAIGREIGLIHGTSPILTGAELPENLDELGHTLDRDGVVVARVTPEDKLRIARALRARGHVVAMTGDGVNDAPALREAAIGIAMGRSGTDVAREAADVVLLDDNFETIVSAIAQGRSTFANIRKFLTYHLADNVAELAPFVVWALTGGRFPLAIGVLQVLALDIGTDVLPALALGAEPPNNRALDGPPVRRHLVDMRLMVRAFAVLGTVEAIVALSAFVVSFIAAGWSPGTAFPGGPGLLAASGAAFTAIVFGQAANAFACRSAVRPAWSIDPRTNPALIVGVAVELCMLALLLYMHPVAHMLGHSAPSIIGFSVAALAIPVVLSADAAYKCFRRRHMGPVALVHRPLVE